MKATIPLLLVIVALVPLRLVAASPASPTPADDPVVAKVGPVEIHRYDILNLVEVLGPQAKAYYETHDDYGPLLQELASRIRISLAAEKAGLDHIPEVRAELLNHRYSTLLAAYVRNVVAPKLITDADIQASYEARKKELSRPVRYRVRQILVTPTHDDKITNSLHDDASTPEDARRKVDFLASRLAAGVDFAELARQYSEDSKSAAKGGELDWFGPGDMVEPFEKAVASLKPGETSKVFETTYGFHIVRLEEIQPAGPPPLAEVRDQLRSDLLDSKKDQVVTEVRNTADALAAKYPLVVVNGSKGE